MKTFLAIYTGAKDSPRRREFDALSETERKAREQEGMQAWGAWVARNQASILDNGGPLGKTKRTGADGVRDITNSMAVYNVVQADSHDAAARLYEGHPHFTIFPGDGVEIMEILPVPGA
jgi:hypothetical protein